MQHHACVELMHHQAYTATWEVVLWWNNKGWAHFCEPILLLRDSNPLRRRCEHAVGRQKWFIGFCYWMYAIFTCTPAGCPFQLVVMFLKISKKVCIFHSFKNVSLRQITLSIRPCRADLTGHQPKKGQILTNFLDLLLTTVGHGGQSL